MHNGHKVYRTGFGTQTFEITCNNDDAYSVAEFLFTDFPGPDQEATALQYDMISSGPVPMLSLWEGDKRLYFGESRYHLAYNLMNEVIFHCINTNNSHHALHAGCVYTDDRCILLPGQSGSGKSSVTSWLVKNGFQYLTDELVFLGSDSRVLPLTRPISLKVGPQHESWLLDRVVEEMITSETGSMIPHRILNKNFRPLQPQVTDIIYPQFNPDSGAELQEISPARSSMYILRSHVNARNLEGHGIHDMTSRVRQCRSYTLSYRSFDDLDRLFNAGAGFFA